ncbi:predicted protein [Nematostella vectensis]|uniref:Pentraxin family member n=1 Tax=Nematostella vectensis TaxID=45351 RepID=A7RL04_NEMVE|nr:predicted protein [Nematostella vectensis]|eukprot:XP_001639835.1 predicted protein [Nematostella vectensis]
MQAATVCLWINTADKTNEGTPFSYATTSRDNEFIIIDYRDVVIYIAQNTTRTGIAVNDGQWHHLCVTWENTAGSWRLYKDGRVAKSGTGLSQGEQIDGGGAVVLGNEQDMLGGGFHQTQSFIGEMSRVNMWRRELSSSEIARMSADCTEGAGDVFDWRDVIRGARGLVEIKRPSTCPAA